jgi:Ca2+-binding RTX toxin-like protein
MRIRNVDGRRALAGLGVAMMAAAFLAGIPSAANALPDFEAANEDVSFGTVAVGSSKDVSVTITNEGSAAGVDDQATSAGMVPPPPTSDDEEFNFVSTTCGTFPGDVKFFDKGDSCTVTYRFTPSDSKPASDTAAVTLAYTQDENGPNPPGATFAITTIEFRLFGNHLCGGLEPTKYGTDGADDLDGTSGNDVIVGLGGDDDIKGGGGSDRVCGGSGDDVLRGKSGRDRLFGDSGSDDLRGGKGRDVCNGGSHVDVFKKCEKVSGLP